MTKSEKVARELLLWLIHNDKEERMIEYARLLSEFRTQGIIIEADIVANTTSTQALLSEVIDAYEAKGGKLPEGTYQAGAKVIAEYIVNTAKNMLP